MALSIGELTGYLSLDASGFTGKVQEALGSLKSKDWQKAGAAAGAASAAALAVGFKSEVDMQAAVNKTSAQLGLTEEEAAKVGKAAGALYRDGLGESMSDVSSATGAVISSFQGMRSATDGEIEEATRSALQFATAMEVDVGGAATTAGILVQNGLAGDAQEAFDLMTKASQKVGPQMVEPLMDATDEYSKHFAMLGMDGDQAMSVLAEAAAGGEIALDKAGDAAKEFGIRATDLADKGAQDALEELGLSGHEVANGLLAGGESAQEMTAKVTEALLGVEDPAKRAELAGGLFGTQIEDIGKDNLPGFLEALGAAEGSLGDVEGATAAMGETMEKDAGTKLRTFARLVQSELMELAAPAVEWLTPMLDGLSGLGKYIGPVVLALGGFAAVVALINGATAVWNGLLAIQRAYTATATAVQWAWNAAMTANPIGLVIAAVAALVAGLVLFFTKTETGQRIWANVWGGIKSAAAAVAGWFTGTLWPLMQAAWDGIAAGATWLWQSVIVPVWGGIKAAVAAVADWVTGTLVPGLQAAWTAVSTAMQWLWTSVVQPVWEGIRVAIALVVAAVITYIDLWVAVFRNVVAPLFTWLWTSIIQPVWQGIQSAIGAVVNWFKGTAVPFIQTAILVAQTAFQGLKDGLSLIWDYIKARIIAPVVSWFQNTVVGNIRSAARTVQDLFDTMRLRLGEAWNAVRVNVIQPVVSWFQNTVVGNFRAAANTVRDLFDTLRLRLNEAWSAIRERVIQPVVTWFQDTIVGTLQRATDRVKDAFNGMKDSVGKAWDAVKNKAKAPIRFVVDTVINNGIVSNFNKIADKFGVKKLPTVSVGFASGGVLPGYTPGRDVHSFYSPTLGRLDLSGGEAIMRPEFTRAVGGAAGVARLNMAARRGGLRSDAFANGGVWGPRHSYAGGGVLDWIRDKAQWVADAVSDPLGSFKRLTDGFLSGIPGAGLMTDVAKGAATRIGEGIGKYLVGRNEADTPTGNLGTGGSLAEASRLARKHGLTMTSGYRPGARTSSGSLSMHGLNRARDYSNSTGPTPQMMAFAREILRTSRPTELLYTPLGAANLHRSGRQYPNSGAVARLHNNHVHVAYRDGGVFGQGYRTGTLNASPGWHMVGEDGPEMVRFRGGEQVKNAHDTARRLGGLFPSDQEWDDFIQAVREGVRDGSHEGVEAGMSGSAARTRTTARMGSI